MKFKAQAGGFIKGLKPIFVVATKGVVKDYQQAGLVTLNAFANGVHAIADGGRVSAINDINNSSYNFDYSCEEDGTVTIRASDFEKTLSSFSPSEMILFELVNGSEFRMSSVSDPEESQTLPVATVCCQFQEIDNSDNDSDEYADDCGNKPTKINIRKDIFQTYANKVMFAYGDQEKYKEFAYWVLRAFGSNSLRFVSGTGTLFAVVEVDGNNVSDSNKNIRILFPNDQTSILLNMLKEFPCIDITIECNRRHICVTCESIKVNIYSCDPGVKWPDENVFLQRNSKFNIVTKAANWKNAIKGILATNSEDLKEENKVHNCILNLDLTKKVINTKTDYALKSSRKVAIEDIGTNEDAKDIKINCVSRYMSEIVSRANDEEFLQFEIESPNSPVVVRKYANSGVDNYMNLNKPTEDGLKERYTIFFATLKD